MKASKIFWNDIKAAHEKERSCTSRYCPSKRQKNIKLEGLSEYPMVMWTCWWKSSDKGQNMEKWEKHICMYLDGSKCWLWIWDKFINVGSSKRQSKSEADSACIKMIYLIELIKIKVNAKELTE